MIAFCFWLFISITYGDYVGNTFGVDINLDKISYKLSSQGWSSDDINEGISEYYKFLYLTKKYHGTNKLLHILHHINSITLSAEINLIGI